MEKFSARVHGPRPPTLRLGAIKARQGTMERRLHVVFLHVESTALLIITSHVRGSTKLGRNRNRKESESESVRRPGIGIGIGIEKKSADSAALI